MWLFRLLYLVFVFLVFYFMKDFYTMNVQLVIVYSVCVFLFSYILEILLSLFKIEKITSILVGIFIFLILGILLTNIFHQLSEDSLTHVCFFIVLLYLGIFTGSRNSYLISKFFNKNILQQQGYFMPLKLLDSSTIIDGRILDIVNTGFLEGRIVIPNFILQELQTISDSHDHLKRQKGRRGLDVVKSLQAQDRIPVEIYNTELKNIKLVDEKLVELAKRLNAVIITTDYNLLKIAEIQDISVLNINGLATAVKQTILPGEVLEIAIIREGKEKDQGIGYIDDGSMVVIENGKKYIGETVSIEVTSLLQSDSGRIIFGKPKK